MVRAAFTLHRRNRDMAPVKVCSTSSTETRQKVTHIHKLQRTPGLGNNTKTLKSVW